MFWYDGAMTDNPLTQVADLAEQLFALLDASPDHLAALLVADGLSRRADRAKISQIAAIDRDGSFAEKGYKTTTGGLKDLLGWDHDIARQHVKVAQHVGPRFTLDGTPLEPVLPVTAAAFAAGATTMRHVGVIAALMNSQPASRISLADRVSIEASLGEAAMIFSPRDVRIMGQDLLAAADQDGPEPDERPGRDELHFGTNADGSGWIRGQFQDPEAFATIVTGLDARTRPSPENRGTTAGERNAAALVEICQFALGYDDTGEVNGERPHLVVTIRLEDLENRARGALLHTGGTLTPAQLRRLACDADLIPVVLGERGEPLDIGRAQRKIPIGIRRLVAARDKGCAHPGCDRPPSWCECHHVIEWQHGGQTNVENVVMLCCQHHDQIHSTEWTIDMSTGIPKFIPPPWLSELWART
jgi:5-methylcytosine-specific restriction protein A